MAGIRAQRLALAVGLSSLGVACGNGPPTATLPEFPQVIVDPSLQAAREHPGSVTVTGDVVGTYSGDLYQPVVCGATDISIHLVDLVSRSSALITMHDDGSIQFALAQSTASGILNGRGGTFHPSKGIDISADLAAPTGNRIHVTGSLVCR